MGGAVHDAGRDAVGLALGWLSAWIGWQLTADAPWARTAQARIAGALILAEVQGRLGVPFEVARGGLREGAALALARVAQAA